MEKHNKNLINEIDGLNEQNSNVNENNTNIADDFFESITEGDLFKEANKLSQKKQPRADKIVSDFLKDRSDNNWKKLQEFFWYGIRKFAHDYLETFMKNSLWETADDMTITTFEKAYVSIDSYDVTKGKFSTWLWTICLNNCRVYKNNYNKLKPLNYDIADLYDSTVLSASCKSSILNDQQFIYKDGNLSVMTHEDLIQTLYNIVKNEINKLGGNYARILNMKLIDNMKIREISMKLDINESTIKNYLYKGKDMLNNIMKTEHNALYDMYIDSCHAVDETKMFGI